MKTLSIDTHPKAEKVLIELLRTKTTAQKFSQVRLLSRTTIQLAKRAIARVNPDMTDDQIDRVFISLHYGEDLARKVENYKRKIQHDNS